MRRFPVSTLRGRMIVVVVTAAVLPLALVGVWVTRSIGRAGETLLRTELEASRDRVARAIATRWSYRQGDLALLSGNAVVQRLVRRGRLQDGADSLYLAQLLGGISSGIARVEYRDANGHVVWSTQADAVDSVRHAFASAPPSSTFTVHRAIVAREGDIAGEMRAVVRTGAILPSDTALQLPNEAVVQLVDRERNVRLLSTMPSDASFLEARTSLTDPPLDLVIAAPRERYVTPFRAAARSGVAAVLMGSALAIALTMFFTRRLTSSLEQLADAADAVASGELDRRVTSNGTDEVRRVGIAFNSMTESLRRTLGELSQRQALAAVGEYAASLSHEVRNALTSVRVDLQHAEEKLAGDVGSKNLIARALASVKRLDGTVTTSLQLARGGRPKRRRVDLRQVLASAARGAERAFAERGAQLQVVADDAALRVQGDPLALEQLFLNLLLNAAQSLLSGGEASMSGDQVDGMARVVVADRGCGIAEADMDRVLDPFYSTKEDGTGLGLPIARQIAVAHGGSLRFSSRPSMGTSVEVRIPLA